MKKSFVSPRLRAMASLAVVLACFGLITPSFAAGPVPAQSAPSGPKIWLQDSQSLPVRYVAATNGLVRPGIDVSLGGNPAQALASGQAQPLSMVKGNFVDGIEDLVVGYAAPGGGIVAFHRGNLDAFAPQNDASFQAIGRGEFPAPFVPDAQVFSVPIRPDFIAAGSFTGLGNTDLAVAVRGGNALYVFAGDGKGNFAPGQTISLPGGVTALAAGEFGTYRSTLIVGVSSRQQSFLAVYGLGQQGLTPLAAVPLSAPASNILFGNFGDSGLDVAFLSNGRVQILRPNLQLATVSLPVSVRALALGRFIYDRNGGSQIALVGSDGSIQIAARNEFDPRVYTTEEFSAIRQAKVNHLPPPPSLVPAQFFPTGWKIVESFPGVGTLGAVQAPVFFRTRVSSNGADDVMWLGASSGQMVVISHANAQPGAQTFLPGQVSVKPYNGSPVSALPMRINVDGRPGVMALQQGQVGPSMLMPIPDPTFFVNKLTDPAPTSPIANACNNVSNVDLTSSCSLREAVLKANATAGADTVQLAAGTYTLTRGRIASPLYDAHDGTLNINDSVSIVGTVDGGGNPASIITWGALTSGLSVDMVFAVNEDIPAPTAADGTFSNLIIQNGVNNGTHSNDGDGGCMEYDSGTNGTANLSLTNVIIQNCATLQGGGGGLVIFNFVVPTGGGFASITNSIIQGNSAVDNPSSGAGGGIALSNDARMVMTNSQVLNNQATQVISGQKGQGGGIIIFFPTSTNGQTQIHNSTISGNKAAGFGGGLQNQADLVIDQGTIISGNSAGFGAVAGQEGGGIYANTFVAGGCPGPSTCTTALSKVTITGNSATGNGGGISNGSNSASGPLTMSFSRLAGNTSGGSGSNFNNNHATATVTNNWWGTNSPASTINSISATTNFDPWIALTNTPNPSIVNVNSSTTLTADFLHNNHGMAIALANIDLLLGLPITFNNAILGTLSNAQTSIQSNGTATATFTTGSTSLPGPQPQAHADAVVDNGTATADITIPLPPVLIKVFGAASVPLNGTTSLSFTLQNNNTVGLSGIAFSDTLPAGLIISTPNGLTGSCGAGTITATQNTNVISLSGGTIAASSFCTFSVNVTGTAAGLQNNTTGTVSATESGTGGTASASLSVEAPPSIAKAFNPVLIVPNATSTLTLTITNPAVNTVAEAGVAVTDTLPANLVVATPNGLSNTCGGTVTAVAGSGSVSLTGGTIATNSSCVVSVNVTSSVAGTYNNTTGAVTSTNGGTGNTASASLTVQPADLTITKTHTDPFSRGQTGATYTITVKNSGAGPTAGTVTVVDTLPNVPNTLVPTAISGTGWTCNLGTLTCTRSDVLAPGASYPAIMLTVNVPINIKANVTNTATVSGGGETNTGNDTATDPTHIGAPIQLIFANSTATVTRGQSASFTFTLESSPGLGAVNFGCSGLPAGTLCSFNPPSSSLLTDTINLNIATSGPSASTAPMFPGGSTYALLFPALGLVGLVFAGNVFAGKRNKKLRLRLALGLSGLALLLALAGCGGRPGFAGTPPGTYTITVTGTSGTSSGSATVTLNVQ